MVFAAFYSYLRHWKRNNSIRDEVVIRIFPQSKLQMDQLRQMKFISNDEYLPDYGEVNGRFKDVLSLYRKGIPAAVVEEVHQSNVDSTYRAYDDILREIDSLAELHPELLRVEDIGKSQFHNKPIRAVKISGNVKKVEDEPAVLFMAGQHAREPLGIDVCMGIIRYLMDHNQQKKVRRWLDNMAIWVVPCLNPDGYDYVLSEGRKFPWWRKNLRDNNENGIFEPKVDGVDLNRNYDFNWGNGGRDEIRSWYYRGAAPGSEGETRALMKLAERERFALAVDYHGFGEVVMYPWALEMTPPDAILIRELAQEFSKSLGKFRSRKEYNTVHLNGQSGQSANWLYANWRTVALIVEVGKEFFPPQDIRQELVSAQLKGLDYLLDRVLSSSLVGHAFDRDTREPLPAMLQLEDDFSPVVAPARCEPRFGRFYRLVLPGRYSITATLDGYKPAEIKQLLVNDKDPVRLEIPMEKLTQLEISN